MTVELHAWRSLHDVASGIVAAAVRKAVAGVPEGTFAGDQAGETRERFEGDPAFHELASMLRAETTVSKGTIFTGCA
jgi:hypothetical protein